MPRPAKEGKGASSPTVMTVEEVARYVRLHPSTIYRLAREGILPGVKVGSQWRFNKERIEQWMVAQESALGKKGRKHP